MQNKFINRVCCPVCLGSLKEKELSIASGNGQLECIECTRRYDVHNHLPLFLLKDRLWKKTAVELQGEGELVIELPLAEHLKRNRFESRRSWNFVKSIPIPDNPSILDIGGSAGIGASLFEKFNPSITIVDIVPQFLILAREVLRNRIQLDVAVADMNWLPFPSDSFDIIFCRQALHHSRTPYQALREMFRTVKPGGSVLLISEPCYPGYFAFKQKIKMRKPIQSGTKTEGILDKLADLEFQYTWQNYVRDLKTLSSDYQIARAYGSAATVQMETGLKFEPFAVHRGPVGTFLSAFLPGGRGFHGDVNIRARKTQPVNRPGPIPEIEPVSLQDIVFPDVTDDEIIHLKKILPDFLTDVEW